MSPLDVEKELFKLKRQMGAYYSKAAYAEALKVANELNREVLDIMGPNNAVHASCLNNIGLMQKKCPTCSHKMSIHIKRADGSLSD
jgi:hypothetical protein